MRKGPVSNWVNLLLWRSSYLAQWWLKLIRAGCSQIPWICCFSFFMIWAAPTAMTPDVLHLPYRGGLCAPFCQVLLFSDHSRIFRGHISHQVRVWKFEFSAKNAPYCSPIWMCYGSFDAPNLQHSNDVFRFLIGCSVAKIFGWYLAYSKVSLEFGPFTWSSPKMNAMRKGSNKALQSPRCDLFVLWISFDLKRPLPSYAHTSRPTHPLLLH